MNFDLLRILEPSKKAGLRIPAHFFENAGSPGSAYNFKCLLLPASCFPIRNLGCCGSARKNAGSREQGARPTFLTPASCKNPLSRCGYIGPQAHGPASGLRPRSNFQEQEPEIRNLKPARGTGFQPGPAGLQLSAGAPSLSRAARAAQAATATERNRQRKAPPLQHR